MDNYSFKMSTAEKHGKWEEEEDERLKAAVEHFGEKQWRLIAEQVQGRTPIQCLHRWSKILKPGLIKGPWSAQEDKKLREWVTTEGPNKWSQCANFIKGRSGKQCRERWFNILNPDVKKGNWEPEEDNLIFKLYQAVGPKWTAIAKELPGRTENSVKNRFYSTVRKMKSQQDSIPQVKPEPEPQTDGISSLLEQMQQLQSLLQSTRCQIVKLESSLGNDGNKLNEHLS